MTKKRKIIIAASIITIIIVMSILLIVLGIVSDGFSFLNRGISKENAETEEITEEDELLTLLNGENVTIQKTDLQTLSADLIEDSDQVDPEADQENEKIAEEINQEPLTDVPVKVHDIYAEAGCEVVFQCYEKAAEAYRWEYYDLLKDAWQEIPEENVSIRKDELHRNVSVMQVKAEHDNHERMFRCTVIYQDKREEAQTGSLFLVKNQIKKICLNSVETEANDYLNTMELPVKVTYQDGIEEEITGLYGLYFLITEENTDYTTSISGNRIETMTKTITECNYQKIGLEEKEYLLRYHPTNREDILETSCTISGKDLYAPVISTVNISPYEVSNIDRAVTLTISIEAEDNETPYPYLEYAFALSGTELTDADWKRKASFDVEITQNGTYIAYVRDESGNVSQMEQKIITVDTKAPVISKVSLTNETGWCKSNTIMVNAEDYGDISYRFISKADGTDSDWITYSEYAVETNGTWIVQAKDSVGNISETEIVVNNIDKEAPIIRSINIKE